MTDNPKQTNNKMVENIFLIFIKGLVNNNMINNRDEFPNNFFTPMIGY